MTLPACKIERPAPAGPPLGRARLLPSPDLSPPARPPLEVVNRTPGVRSLTKLTPLFLALCLYSHAAYSAGLEWLPGASPQAVFEGKARPIRGIFRNSGNTDLEVNLRIKLWLTSSSTAVPVGPSEMRRSFHVPASQTVIEDVPVDFPPVKAKTSFLLEWINSQDTVIAKTTLLVFPTNLLQELKTLAGTTELGLFDPENRFKDELNRSGIPYSDLEHRELEQFTGKLVIFNSGLLENDQTPSRLLSKARKGAAILWIRRPKSEQLKLEPASFLKSTSGSNLVITDASLFADFPKHPPAHLNLVRLARWAVQGEKTDWLIPGDL